MTFLTGSITVAAEVPSPSPSAQPVPEEEEYYSSWSLFLVCMLLILSLWTSYYLQIKRIRAVHETVVSIFAGMFVGLVVRLSPGTMIREMLVSTESRSVLPPNSEYCCKELWYSRGMLMLCFIDVQAYALLQSPPATHHLELRV